MRGDAVGTHSFTRHELPVLKGTVQLYEPWLAGTDAIAPPVVRFVVNPRPVPSVYAMRTIAPAGRSVEVQVMLCVEPAGQPRRRSARRAGWRRSGTGASWRR